MSKSISWGVWASLGIVLVGALGVITTRDTLHGGVSAQSPQPLIEPPRYEKICASGETFCTHWKIYQRY